MLHVNKMSSGQDDSVSFKQGDVSALEFADDSFDFVFTRYLLMRRWRNELLSHDEPIRRAENCAPCQRV
jgi:ubiquinone/menaquinone biosynthesis C-methylase UbiE